MIRSIDVPARQTAFLRPRLPLCLSCGLLFVFLIGCGRSQYPETAHVEGTVTLDGRPIENATIIFAPNNSRASRGRTNERGEYTLTFKKRIPGAVLGDHQVSISKYVPDNSKSAVAYSNAMHKRQRTLDLAAGFIPDEDSAYDSEPTATGMNLINLLPDHYEGSESVLTATVEPRGNVIDFDLSSDAEN
jgi:hypothetical protein